MTEHHPEVTAWDDGVSEAIGYKVPANGTQHFVNGPAVITGFSLHNEGAAATSLEWTDGGGPFMHDQVGGTTFAQRPLPDRGVAVRTSLELAVGVNGPVDVVVYYRHKYGLRAEER